MATPCVGSSEKVGGNKSKGWSSFLFIQPHIVLLYIQVIVFVCDGAKPNRKFLKSCGTVEKNGIVHVYKTRNRYCHDRYIYFISHLIKTTRNCWYSSNIGGTRCMWVSAPWQISPYYTA